jgi:hypothetical protein
MTKLIILVQQKRHSTLDYPQSWWDEILNKTLISDLIGVSPPPTLKSNGQS